MPPESSIINRCSFCASAAVAALRGRLVAAGSFRQKKNSIRGCENPGPVFVVARKPFTALDGRANDSKYSGGLFRAIDLEFFSLRFTGLAILDCDGRWALNPKFLDSRRAF